MLREMTGPQLVEWEQYFALFPWGAHGADLLNAVNCATVASVVSAFGGGRPVNPSKFLTFHGAPKRQEQSPDDIRILLDAISVKRNGTKANRQT